MWKQNELREWHHQNEKTRVFYHLLHKDNWFWQKAKNQAKKFKKKGESGIRHVENVSKD